MVLSSPNEGEDDITNERDNDDDGADVLEQVRKEFLERVNGEGPPEVSTGILALDRAIIGLRPKKTMVIAGRPGMGKTALAASLRRNVLTQGYTVLDFNLEMGKEELAERELAFQTKVNLRRIMSGRDVADEELSRIRSGEGALPKGKWWVYDTCFNIEDIIARARAAKKRAKRQGETIGLVVIDYLQLMGDTGGEGRQQSVSACSRMCKLLSKEMDCTVLVLSQLNRNCDYREDKRPLAADLRESGAIEQDADIILFVYRDVVYNPNAPSDEAELIIRKNRAGPLGTVKVRFNPRTTHFDDLPSRPLAMPTEYQS